MSRYYDYGGWAPYVPVAERRRQAVREMEKLRRKGHAVSPVVIEGRAIAATFWGKAWCDNLESYRDFENRLPRGRTYVRNGSVVDLHVAPREVTAKVSGSSMYTVTVSVGEVPSKQWKSICADCAGGIDSLVELLQGRFSKGVMERICRQGSGLFPKPSEIRFDCSCPDGASMCKHVAAVLYGVGARLDAQPELLFRLRAVNENDLVAHIDQALPMAKSGPAPDAVLQTDDLSAMFGLDMAEANVLPAVAGGVEQPRGRRKTATRVKTRPRAESSADRQSAPPRALRPGRQVRSAAAKRRPVLKAGEPGPLRKK